MKIPDCNAPKTMPKVPKTIEVEIEVTQTIDAEVFLPFYYASISSFWIYFEVDPKKLEPFLENTGLKPAVFGGKGLVNLNFQNYTAHNGNGLAATNELEFNIVAYPEARSNDVPELSADCFLRGEDQTKTIGQYRLHVPCDNKFAVAAGKALFGENKFFALFSFTVPSVNLPTANTWQYTINDISKDEIISVKADFHHLKSSTVNPSTIIDYSLLNSRLVGSRRNIWATVQSFQIPPSESKNIEIKIGKSTFKNMAADLAKILGKNKDGLAVVKPVAIQVIQTPPVIAESRPFYAGY